MASPGPRNDYIRKKSDGSHNSSGERGGKFDLTGTDWNQSVTAPISPMNF